MRGLLIALVSVWLSGCALQSVKPPARPLDLCAVLEEKRHWRDPLAAAEQKWMIPAHVLMASVYHESSYRHDARPPAKYYFGLIPGARPTTAYGYSQALDGTWAIYVRETGRWFPDRTDFGDAIDFVGWYHAKSTTLLGLAPSDARHLYLAYHEGHTGFTRQTYRQKPWLMRYADRVANTAETYRQQLQVCRAEPPSVPPVPLPLPTEELLAQP